MRLLFRDRFYDPLASETLLESQYEAIVLQESPSLFPDYVAVRFKGLIRSDYGNARADLALIHREYKSWWVVEVELSHHSLEDHVLPQVEILANGDYGEAEAVSISGEAPSLIADKVLDVVKGAQPRVLVVADAAPPRWVSDLARYGALVCVVQVFRNPDNRYLLRIDGRQPVEDSSVLSRCRVLPRMPAMVRVDSPGVLPLDAREGFEILVGQEITRWKRVDTGDGVWLVPEHQNPLPPGTNLFELVRSGEGRLLLRPGTFRRGGTV